MQRFHHLRKQIHTKYSKNCICENKSTQKLTLQKLFSIKITLFEVLCKDSKSDHNNDDNDNKNNNNNNNNNKKTMIIMITVVIIVIVNNDTGMKTQGFQKS